MERYRAGIAIRPQVSLKMQRDGGRILSSVRDKNGPTWRLSDVGGALWSF
jgi:hypothetical protein